MALGGHFENGTKPGGWGGMPGLLLGVSGQGQMWSSPFWEEGILGFHRGLQRPPPPTDPPPRLPVWPLAKALPGESFCLSYRRAGKHPSLLHASALLLPCHQDTLFSWHPACHAVTGQPRGLPPGRDTFQQTLVAGEWVWMNRWLVGMSS